MRNFQALLLLLVAVAAACAATTASAADAAPWHRWSGGGFGTWRRRRRAVALADAIIAGAARDAKESAAATGEGGALSAAARQAAADAAAAGPPARTQAGCPCLPYWAFGAVEYAQCANPNRDPLGYWCAVDLATCPGYYGAFPQTPSTTATTNDATTAATATTTTTPTTPNQQLLAYDYCVGTDASGQFWPGPRERTTSGCLCQAGRWTLALPGEDSAAAGALGPSVAAGKSAYYDRCTRPGGAGTARQCVVDVRTCPDPQALMASGSAGSGGQDAVDSCPELAEGGPATNDDGTPTTAADADVETAAALAEQRAADHYFASAPAESHRTISGCSCDPGGWRYTYPDGSTGPLMQGCFNPDGDPLGPWCAVDPAVCLWFAGEIRRGTANATREQGGTVVAYDYCRLPDDEAERDPLAARLSRRAAALASAAREEMARTADLLARQRRAVKDAIAARGAAWLDGAAAGVEEAAAVLQREAAREASEAAGGGGGGANDGSSSSGNDDTNNSAADSDPKAWASLPPASCRLEQLQGWAQCGGKSACGDWACADAAWPGRCCPGGFVCERQHSFYWQCVPPQAAASFGGDAAEAGAVAAVVAGAGGGGDADGFAPAEPLCDPAARRAREERDEAAALPPLPALLPALAQCGGLADCPDSVRGSAGCGDRAWPGFCCPAGSVCRRQRGNPFYWQCLPEGQDGEGVVGASGPREGAVPPPLDDGLRAPVADPGPSLAPPPPLSPLAASGLVLEPESGAAYAPEGANLSPGRGFVVEMKLDGDYNALLAAADGSDAAPPTVAMMHEGADSAALDGDAATTTTTAAPPALRALKSGLVGVVAAAAAVPPGALYRVEVTGVRPGSIVADVGVVFAAEADEAEVSAAYTRLRERAGPGYAASSLPARFGALDGLTISAEQGGYLVPLARGERAVGGSAAGARLAASASAAGKAKAAGPGVDADAAFGRRKTVGVLGSGAIAGVAVACLAGLAAAGFAVQKGAAARAKAVVAAAAAREDGGGDKASSAAAPRNGQADKSAQLRYLAGEADEGDMARELAAEGKLGPDEVEGGRELLRQERERRRENAGGGGGQGGSGSGSGRPWVGAWLDALERRKDGGGGRNLVAWPLRSQAQSPSSASPPSPPHAAGATAAAHLPRVSRASDGGGTAAAADVAAYATAVPGPSGTVSRRASKNAV